MEQAKWSASSLLKAFNMKYGGYVCIDADICQQFLNDFSENMQTVDNLYEWCISQDKALEVVE